MATDDGHQDADGDDDAPASEAAAPRGSYRDPWAQPTREVAAPAPAPEAGDAGGAGSSEPTGADDGPAPDEPASPSTAATPPAAGVSDAAPTAATPPAADGAEPPTPARRPPVALLVGAAVLVVLVVVGAVVLASGGDDDQDDDASQAGADASAEDADAGEDTDDEADESGFLDDAFDEGSLFEDDLLDDDLFAVDEVSDDGTYEETASGFVTSCAVDGLCITGVSLVGDELSIEFESSTAGLEGTDLVPVFFLATLDPADGAIGASSDDLRVWGLRSPMRGEGEEGDGGWSTDEVGGDRNVVCVLVGDRFGGLEPGSGNCAELPDGV